MMDAGHLKVLFSWQPPRRSLLGNYALAALSGTLEGRLTFRTDSDILWADCCYPLTKPWQSLVDDDRTLPLEHGKNIESLGHILSVLAASATVEHDMFYESPGLTRLHPMSVNLTQTMWDYPGFPPDLVPEEILACTLRSDPGRAGAALPFLAEAGSINNPVARFLCVWQALVFHIGVDRPSEVDRDFFDRVGVPRDCAGPRGSETKYTQFRNMLSHPKDRDIPEYAELDAAARNLADSLAVLVLRDIVAGSSRH